MSTDEQPRKRMKVLHQSLTMINHATNIHDTSPIFNDYLLDLHQPDPMVLPREQPAWPSSDVDHPDSPHDDSDVSYDLDHEMLGGVLDIDLDAVNGGGDQASLKSKVKVKGKRGPGDHGNIDPDLDAFINANLLPEGDPR